MSVEIEVGLENAAKVRPAPEQEILLEEPPKGLKNPKVKRLLAIGGVVLIAVLAALLLYYHNRETTDDAQVDGHITPIASKIYGRVAEVLVNDIETVAGMRCQLSRSNRQHAAVGKHDDAIGGNDSGHRRGEPLCHAGRFLASSVIESRD